MTEVVEADWQPDIPDEWIVTEVIFDAVGSYSEAKAVNRKNGHVFRTARNGPPLWEVGDRIDPNL